MEIQISVIIPAYKSQNLIKKTLESILAQEFSPIEVIVVDDGSPDNTSLVVKEFGDQVKLTKIDNIGTTGARKVGVSKSKGNYLAFCDHDDIWEKDHLKNLAEIVESNNLSFAFSNFVHFRDGIRQPISHFEADNSKFWMNPGISLGNDFFIANDPLLPNVLNYQAIFPSCSLVSKDLYERVGGFNADFGRNVSEDLEFTLRCVREAPVGVITKPTVQIHRHGKNYSGDWIRGLKDSMEILKYSELNHDLQKSWKQLIGEQILIRSIEGVDFAFNLGKMSEVRNFSKNLSDQRIGWKTRLKIFIATLPDKLSKPIGATLTRVR